MSKNGKFISEKYAVFENAENAVHTFTLGDFDGGVRFCRNAGSDASVLTLNMIGDSGRLCSLAEPYAATLDTATAQVFTALGSTVVRKHCRGDGADLLLFGKSIVIRLASGVFKAYRDKLSGTANAVFFREGIFYVTDGNILYKVSAYDGGITEASPKIPVLYNDVDADGTALGSPDEAINIFTDEVAFRYKTTAKTYFNTPWNVAVDGSSIRVKNPSGAFLSTSDYTVTTSNTGYRVTLNTAATTGGYTLYCRLVAGSKSFSLYTLNAARAVFCNMNPYLIENISETSYDTVLCGYGVPSEPRTIYFYKLNTSALYLPCDGMTSKNLPYKISGILPYYGGYLALTEYAVYRLDISAGGTAGESKATLLKSDFGCDMPGSAVAFDDKIIFGNSKRGIFCFDRYGIGERDTNRKISENIEWGDYGFFSCTETERKTAKADFCGGLYVLAVGAKTYIWNYFAHAPSATSDSEKNEKAHIWYLRTDMSAREILCSAGDAINYIPAVGSIPMIASMRHDSESASSNLYSSITTDLSASGKEKVVTGIRIYARSAGSFTLSLRYDGVSSPDVYTAENTGGYGTIKNYLIRPFRRRFNYFSIEISSENPIVIDRVMIDYIAVK